MTNGNMATISPVSEEDMSKVRQVFDDALNALVNMSALRQDVDTLRTQVADLTNTVNRYRSQIDTLDDALYRTRQDRDAANNRATDAESAKARAESDLQDAQSTIDTLRQQLSTANDTIARLRKESDEHLTTSLEWEDRFNGANKKLNDIKAHFSDMFPKEEPKPVAPPPDQSYNPVPFPIPQTTTTEEHRDSGDEAKEWPPLKQAW